MFECDVVNFMLIPMMLVAMVTLIVMRMRMRMLIGECFEFADMTQSIRGAAAEPGEGIVWR